MKRNLGMTLPFLSQKVKKRKKSNPITFIRACKDCTSPTRTLLFPCKFRGTMKSSLLLHSEDQKERDKPPSETPHSLGPPHQGKTPSPSPTRLSFSKQPARDFLEGRLPISLHCSHVLDPFSLLLHSARC